MGLYIQMGDKFKEQMNNEWRCNVSDADAFMQSTRASEFLDEYENNVNHVLWPSQS